MNPLKKKSSRDPDIEMKDLLLFWNIIQYGSFGRAGEAMGFSQPKVTRRVMLLEKRFGTQLLFRNARGVALTRSGEHVLEMARSFVERLHAVRMMAEQEAGENGQVTVASASGFGHFWLVPVLKEFMDLHPHIQVSFKPEEAGDVNLMLGQADILIASEPAERSSLSCDLLCSYPFHLYAHNSYTKQKGIPQTLKELDAHDLIVWSQAKHVDPMASQGLLHLGLPDGKQARTPKALVQDDHSLFAMVLNGVGIGIAPAFFFEDKPDFVRIPCFDTFSAHSKPEGRKYILHSTGHAPSSRVQTLVEFIKQKASGSPFFT